MQRIIINLKIRIYIKIPLILRKDIQKKRFQEFFLSDFIYLFGQFFFNSMQFMYNYLFFILNMYFLLIKNIYYICNTVSQTYSFNLLFLSWRYIANIIFVSRFNQQIFFVNSSLITKSNKNFYRNIKAQENII